MTASQKPALVATWLVSAHSPQIFAVRRRGATCQHSESFSFPFWFHAWGLQGAPGTSIRGLPRVGKAQEGMLWGQLGFAWAALPLPEGDFRVCQAWWIGEGSSKRAP